MMKFVRHIGLLVVVLLAGCGEREEAIQRIEGDVFGTFYQISLAGEYSDEELRGLRSGVEAEFAELNNTFSTYTPDSELMRLNAHPVGEWLNISPELALVLDTARQVSSASEGAFDATVGSLVNLWTFGPEARAERMPSDAELQARLAEVGYRQLEVDTQALRARRLSDHFIDLSGIAKGYAVDRVSQWLLEGGHESHMVNIGGDLIGRGERTPGQPWRMGIELPDSSRSQIARHILPLSNLSAAGSGDYRNYFEADGQRFSHTIDPRTGRPVEHHLAAVTVLHASNMLADAWATALMVAGPEAAQAISREHDLLALTLSRNKAGGWDSWASPALVELYGEEQLVPYD